MEKAEYTDSYDSDTRMIAMGERPLMEGLSLLGFETWPNATEEDLDGVLTELIENEQKALILLETYLSKSELPILNHTRMHGGYIIITEIPALNSADNYHPFIEELVIQVLGSHVLEKSDDSK